MDCINGNILIYQNEKGDTKVDVYLNGESVWMTQKSIAELYQTSSQNITLHIKNIYKEGELQEEATCKNYLQVQNKKPTTNSASCRLFLKREEFDRRNLLYDNGTIKKKYHILICERRR